MIGICTPRAEAVPARGDSRWFAAETRPGCGGQPNLWYMQSVRLESAFVACMTEEQVVAVVRSLPPSAIAQLLALAQDSGDHLDPRLAMALGIPPTPPSGPKLY